MTFLLALLALAVTRLDIRTNAGRDHQARVMGDNASDGSGPYASASYMGLTADTNAPDAANTVLNGEISSGTLARSQAVFAHTNGTALYTLTKSFTSDQSVTIAKYGIFTEAAGGTMAFETTIDPVVLRSGDQVQITHAVIL